MPVDPQTADIMLGLFIAGMSGFLAWLFRKVERIEKNHVDIAVLDSRLATLSDSIIALRAEVRELRDEERADHATIGGRVDKLDEKIDRVSEDVAYMRGRNKSLHPT